ncbi:MAG: hypothetical protein KDG54_11225 [Geminicoccaceae bacterium]|nr:hypothetical protein [Geminicoccaceae bacterium]
MRNGQVDEDGDVMDVFEMTFHDGMSVCIGRHEGGLRLILGKGAWETPVPPVGCIRIEIDTDHGPCLLGLIQARAFPS